MAKGAKLIIIILVTLFLGSILLIIQIATSKEARITEYSNREKELRQKADDLSSQLSAAQTEKKRLEDKFGSVRKDIEGISVERDEWKKKYDLVLKEKNDLVQKMQTMPKRREEPSAVGAAPSDEGYWADVLKDKAGLELQLNELKSQLSEMAIQIEEAKKEKAEWEVELTQFKQSNEGLEGKIKYGVDLANALSLELAREKNDKKKIAEQLSTLKEENLSLRYQIKELATSKVSLEKSLQRLVSDKEKLDKRLQETEQVVQSRIEEMLEIKKDLEARLPQGGAKSLTEAKPIELAPIIVRSSPTTSVTETTPAGSLTGKVISVNEENNFVIIDLGESAGVKTGDTFKIYHNNKQIASIEVIQTRPDISAADIKQKSQKIQTADLVK